MGARVLDRLEGLVQAELASCGAEPWEPAGVLPLDLADRAGRRTVLDPATPRWRDRLGRELSFPAGAETLGLEVAAGLVRSYRQLPRVLAARRARWRDLERTGPGLFALRETRVVEALALEGDGERLQGLMRELEAGLLRALRGAGAAPLVGPASPTLHGGVAATGMWLPHPAGPEELLMCRGCGHVAAADVLVRVDGGGAAPEEDGAPVEVATPDQTSIEEVARFLDVPVEATAKAVFFANEGGRLVFAVVRGDEEVAEPKLARAVGARALRPASDEEIRAAGAVPGYASPIGLGPEVAVVVGPRVAHGGGLIGGANREGYHLQGLRFGRDYSGEVADITRARLVDACPECGERQLEPVAAVPVAGVVDLGDAAEALGGRVQPENGKPAPPHAGVAWVDLLALLGGLGEERIPPAGGPPGPWPVGAAPVDVHLVSLAGKDEDCRAAAEDLARALGDEGLTVALDDRPGGAGAKFADAELLGAPLWVVLGPRGLRDGVAELRDPGEGSRRELPLGELPARAAARRRALMQA
jgi:prolyl-tRNA synthetase